MLKRRLITGLAAVWLFWILSLLTSLAGMERTLNLNLVLAAISIIVVTGVARYVAPRRERERG